MSAFSEVQSLVVRKAKVAVAQRLGPQMAHDARVEAQLDHMTDSLVVQIRTDLLRHQVDAQAVRVPFSKTETQEVPGPRFVVPVFAALVIVAVVVGAMVGSLAVFFVAGAIALAGVVVYAANPPRDVTLTAAGEAVVERDLFNAFPDATIVYPEGFGDIWLPMQDVRSWASYNEEGA